MLHLDVQIGDTLVIDGGRVLIQLTDRKGKGVRVAVDAPRQIGIAVLDEEALARSKGLTLSPKAA